MIDTSLIDAPVVERPVGGEPQKFALAEIAEITGLLPSSSDGMSEDERDMLRWADDGGRNLD